MASRYQLSILAVLLFLLIGCTSPVTQPNSPTEIGVTSPPTSSTPPPQSGTSDGPTATQTGLVRVHGGEFPFDPDLVWNRTLALHGGDAAPPMVRIVPFPNETKSFTFVSHPAFAQALGVGPFELPSNLSEGPGGRYTREGVVYIYPRNASADELEAVLVHEFVHHIQRQADVGPVPYAVSEGAAKYIEDRYAERYLESVDPAARLEDRYMGEVGGNRYWFGLYHFGYRHFLLRTNDTGDVWQVYDAPPQTDEQLIHGGTPASHPAKPLEIDINDTGSRWLDWVTRDTMGELFIRVTLAQAVPEPTAARGAAGWGNDLVAEFRDSDSTPGYVWAIRWDTADDADEFEAVFEQFLDDRATVENGRWVLDDRTVETHRLDTDTLVVVVGPQAFIDDVVVSGSNSTVKVRLTS